MTAADHNLFTAFAENFPPNREDAAVLLPAGRTLSYADLERESARMARLLTGIGLRPGDRLTVQAQKSPQVLWLYLACLRAGLVFHPLNDGYKAEELRYLLADAEPGAIICGPDAAAMFTELAGTRLPVLTLDEQGAGSLTGRATTIAPEFHDVPRQASDLAVLLYTSGTTGKPKGAMITHGNLAANARALVSAWGFSRQDRLLHALPIYHAHGLLVGVGCTLMSGASMIFLARFDADEVIRWLPACSVMMGVPTYYSRLLAHPGLTRSVCAGVRVFISGSAPLSPLTCAAFRERTGHVILERYGMTETGMNTSNPLQGERRPGSVGLPLPGVSVRIVDEAGEPLPAEVVGEIQLMGANVFRGYWRAPGKTAESFTADGYLRSGDLGSMSGDGYLTIVGRSKDLVITGGLNVYPRELEVILDELPGVAESAVIGLPHPDFGEAVVAVIVAKPGEAPDEAGIIAALRHRIAGFKLPKRVFLIGELPRNNMGKVDKARLRGQYTAAFRPESARNKTES